MPVIKLGWNDKEKEYLRKEDNRNWSKVECYDDSELVYKEISGKNQIVGV